MKIVAERKNVGIWAFAGFAVVSFFGSLLHFLYEWTASDFVAVFSAVNESTWEHMKIYFFPSFLFAIVQYFFFGKGYGAYWCVKLKSALLGLAMIPVLFYTMQGIFGKTPDWVNVTTFFVAGAIGFSYEYRAFKKEEVCKWGKVAFALLCIIAVLFGVFTFFPPKIPLFQNPIDGSFGIAN